MKDQTEKTASPKPETAKLFGNQSLNERIAKKISLMAVKICQLENESSFEKRNVTSFSNFTDR